MISACIVLFDPHAEVLRASVEALVDSVDLAGEELEIVYVENGGKYGDQIPDVRARQVRIALDENMGFGYAMNRAVAAAAGDRVLLLNPDAVLAPEAIRHLLTTVRVGRRILASPLMESGGGLQIDAMTLWMSSVERLITRGRKRRRLRAAVETGSEVSVEKVSGGALFAFRHDLQELGPFDERFFLYGEDADLSLRARALGFELIVVSAARADHLGGESARRHGRLVEAARQDAALRLVAYHRPFPVALTLRVEALLAAVAGTVLGGRSTSPSAGARLVRLEEIRRWSLLRDAPRFDPGDYADADHAGIAGRR